MRDSSAGTRHWQQGLLGCALIAAEAQLLATTFDDVFGQELLQLGTWGDGRELLAHSRIRRQSVVTEDRAGNGADLVSNLAHLPINTACVDAVLLPHTLEYAADPYAVLREADRVLVAEGQLIILAFRPLSFWGLRSAATRGGYPPGLRRQLGAARLRDWLGLLSYEIVTERPYLYHLPAEPGSPTDAVVARMLHRGWFNPWPSGAYLIKARKRVYTLTPIRPRLRERVKVLGGLVEPSM